MDIKDELRRAALDVQAGELSRARGLVLKVLEKQPDSGQAWFLIAHDLSQSDEERLRALVMCTNDASTSNQKAAAWAKQQLSAYRPAAQYDLRNVERDFHPIVAAWLFDGGYEYQHQVELYPGGVAHFVAERPGGKQQVVVCTLTAQTMDTTIGLVKSLQFQLRHSQSMIVVPAHQLTAQAYQQCDLMKVQLQPIDVSKRYPKVPMNQPLGRSHPSIAWLSRAKLNYAEVRRVGSWLLMAGLSVVTPLAWVTPNLLASALGYGFVLLGVVGFLLHSLGFLGLGKRISVAVMLPMLLSATIVLMLSLPLWWLTR
ncbi:MAG: hypothetical protein GYB68_01375 [Chloroflexi bacterium]|nr:hypothetical protein [Chloroflexota bacterium]